MVYKGRWPKKSSNRTSKFVLSRLVSTWHFKFRISFATELGANFGCDRFRHLKSLCCSIRIWADVLSSVLGQARQIRSAALHRNQFGTCCFVPIMSYFYLETNDWANDWAKRWALLWPATTFRQFQRNFHFTWKKSDLSLPEIYKAKILLTLWTESVQQEW